MTQYVRVNGSVVVEVGMAPPDHYTEEVAATMMEAPDDVQPFWKVANGSFAAPTPWFTMPVESLASVQAALCADIDAEAEEQRLRYITAGSGQAMVYLQKQTQAAIALNAQAATAAATADANAAAYPLLAAEVGITVDPTTNAAATDVLGVARQVNATVQQWMPIAAAIERARMATKAAIMAATTAAAAQAARDAVQWPAPA